MAVLLIGEAQEPRQTEQIHKMLRKSHVNYYPRMNDRISNNMLWNESVFDEYIEGQSYQEWRRSRPSIDPYYHAYKYARRLLRRADAILVIWSYDSSRNILISQLLDLARYREVPVKFLKTDDTSIDQRYEKNVISISAHPAEWENTDVWRNLISDLRDVAGSSTCPSSEFFGRLSI